MFSRAALAVFVVVVTEIVLFGAMARVVGVIPVVVVSMAAAVVGMVLIRRNVGRLVTGGIGPLLEGDTSASVAGDRLLRALAGLLLIVPGLLTGLTGAVLLLPPVRALVGAQARRRLARFIPSDLGLPFVPNGWSRTGSRSRFWAADVVDVDVVREEPTTSAPPELN
ncbi:MAG: FxsA family protein [Acidimicrobiales bacterium]